jgi:hypothetical protein
MFLDHLIPDRQGRAIKRWISPVGAEVTDRECQESLLLRIHNEGIGPIACHVVSD